MVGRAHMHNNTAAQYTQHRAHAGIADSIQTPGPAPAPTTAACGAASVPEVLMCNACAVSCAASRSVGNAYGHLCETSGKSASVAQ